MDSGFSYSSQILRTVFTIMNEVTSTSSQGLCSIMISTVKPCLKFCTRKARNSTCNQLHFYRPESHMWT